MMVKAQKLDPDRIYHVQVRPGKVVVYGELAFGDRCTLQVPGSAVEALTAGGDAYLVDPAEVPDAATIE